MLSRNMRLAVVSSLSACPWTEGGRCLLVSDTHPDTRKANEHLARGQTSETGATLVRRRLVNIAQALKHIKCWGVCGHQESGADSGAVQADPNWHCLGSCHLDLATDNVASDKLFGLSSPCCPPLRSDLRPETFTFS